MTRSAAVALLRRSVRRVLSEVGGNAGAASAIARLDDAFTSLTQAVALEPDVAPHVGRGRPITLGFGAMQGALTALEAFRDGGPAGPALEGLEAAIGHLVPPANATESERLLDAIDELRDAADAVSRAAHARSSVR